MNSSGQQCLLMYEGPRFGYEIPRTRSGRRQFTLLGDPYVKIFLLALLLLILPYLLPVLSRHQWESFAGYYVDLFFLLLVMVGIQHRLSLIDSPWERRLWNFLTLAFLVRWLVELAYVVVPQGWWGPAAHLAADAGHLLSYLAIFVAVAGRPHRPLASVLEMRHRLPEVGGAGALVFGLAVYLVLIPSRLSTATAAKWLSPFSLYVALDLLLVVFLAWLVVSCKTVRWRILYGLLGLTCFLWAGVDLVSSLAYGGLLDWAAASRLDLLRLLPAVTVVVAARLRHHPFSEETESAVGEPRPDSGAGLLGLRSPLLVAAFVLPAIHLGSLTLGLVDEPTKAARDVVAFVSLLVLGGLAIVDHELLARRSTRLAGERRRADEARQRSEIACHRAEREAQRRMVEGQLQQTLRVDSFGVLAGGIAHDFNNLLTGVVGNAELARLALSPISPVQGLIRRIEAAGWRAAELSRQMLAFTGNGRYAVERIELSELIQELDPLIRAIVSKKAILNYNLDPDLPPVEADAVQVRQAILNLLVNASEALGGKRGLVAIETGVKEYDRRELSTFHLGEALEAGPFVYVEISDTGCGMNEETQAKIFDPLFTTKCGGQGLGLAATLGILRCHQGAIKVASEPGAWTAIRILMPAAQWPAVKETPAELPVKDWSGDGATVLLVDDEKLVRQMAMGMLESMGFEVLEAADGRQAVETFRRHADQIALVLLDVIMPEMDGEEALREIRRIRSDARVILCTGYDPREIMARFEGTAVDGFIRKPFELATLREKLRRALDTEQLPRPPAPPPWEAGQAVGRGAEGDFDRLSNGW